MARVILHVDLDAFFASVEEREHPEYRGKPVVVGADPKEGKGRGVVSTANYEAREYGIHSAMPISQAYHACPEAIFVRPDFSIYHAYSDKVMAILKNYGEIEQVSVDEAYIDATAAVERQGSSEYVVAEIRKRILEDTGLTCSIGVASNKLVAKVASDFRKPAGLTIVRLGGEAEFLAPLGVRKLLYVGPKTEEHLKRFGITTVAQLAGTGIDSLVKEFGKFGSYLYDAARGIGDDIVSKSSGHAKSISRNNTFEKDTKDRSSVEQVIGSMVESIIGEMVDSNCVCRTIGVRVRFSDFETFTRERTIEHSTQDAAVINGVILKLLQPFYDDKRMIRQVGVRVSSLSEKSNAQKTVADFIR